MPVFAPVTRATRTPRLSPFSAGRILAAGAACPRARAPGGRSRAGGARSAPTRPRPRRGTPPPVARRVPRPGRRPGGRSIPEPGGSIHVPIEADRGRTPCADSVKRERRGVAARALPADVALRLRLLAELIAAPVSALDEYDISCGEDKTTRPARAAAGAVLHRPPRTRRGGGGEGRP